MEWECLVEQGQDTAQPKDRLKHARMEWECLVEQGQNTAQPKDRLKHPVQPQWFPSASSGT